MESILPLLEGVYYLATVEGDQPRVRPFDNATIKDGKLYIGTTSDKAVYKQILDNPKVEIFAMGARGTIRISAEAYPVEDPELNREVYEDMGKDSDAENIAALELRNVKGYIKTPTGTTEF
jgi:uncharacterized pyridoxamine 5'-phosphate oxidase family protein